MMTIWKSLNARLRGFFAALAYQNTIDSPRLKTELDKRGH